MERTKEKAMRSAATIVGHLNELIRALDRRRPQPRRPGEAAIARDSAALRSRALARIAEIERESAPHGEG
jgi:hypothetical protein